MFLLFVIGQNKMRKLTYPLFIEYRPLLLTRWSRTPKSFVMVWKRRYSPLWHEKTLSVT